MNVLKTTSEGVYTRFLQRHRLREKRPEIETKISVERICAQLKDFHRRAEWIYSLLRITPAQIVQFDEIALSMSGSLSSAARRIGVVGQSLVSETCALFDCKKCATGVFFLSTQPIPPLVFFRGSEDFVDKTANHAALRYTKKGNMTEEAFIAHVLPHIKKHNPECRVVVFDSATSHVTPKCREAVNTFGMWDLVMPANCTAMVQALDVYYFGVYRKTHSNIVTSMVENNGIDMYKTLSLSERRRILAEICTLTASVIAVDVAAIFTQLGYINPSRGVTLPHLPNYSFRAEDVDAEWLAKVSPTRTERVVLADPALVEEVVEALTSQPVQGTQRREKRPRPVEVACTCGHGPQPGRHKRECAKNVRRCETVERKQTALERMLTQKSESQLASNPIEAPKKALEPLLARGTPRFQNDEFIDADAEVERILFPNDEEVVFVSAEEPLWACFTPQKMISTRTIAALLGLISDIFPDDILIDPLQFEMLRAGKGYHPRLLGMKMCVIAYHNRHFVAFGYCPYRKHQVSYDCERDYFDLDRKDLFCEFAQWLERGGNEIEHVTSKKEFIQEPLSNDCALHAVNNVIHFLCGQRGALDREELRKKHMNPAHPLRFLIEDRSAPIFFVSHTPCEDCGTKLRQMKSRNGDPFWGCPNLICRSEKKTAWRKAWDM